jgi:glycosyltransferase involved in cell wall biosynthesis
MHTLFIVRRDPFKSPSGTEIFAGNLALELAKQGHKVELVYESQSSSGAPIESIDGIEAYELRLIGIPYLRALHYCHKCVKVCTDLIKNSNIDTVIFFGAGTLAGYTFKKIKGLAEKPLLVYYAVDSMAAEYERSKPALLKRGVIQRLKAWIWYKALVRSDKLSCNVAGLVIASCKDTAHRIVEDYGVVPEKVKFVYFGLPGNYAEGFESHDAEIPTFLHVSTVPERKGTLYFLEALKFLQDKYNLRVRGVIAGSKETFYVELAKKLDIDVVFLGRIPNNELKQYYASSTALVSPSLSEGFCLPVVEAAAFGKPSIVTEVGSLPELVSDRENGFVIPVADVSALSERMYEIAVDDVLRKHLSEKSKKSSHRFKISTVSRELMKIINDDENIHNVAFSHVTKPPSNLYLRLVTKWTKK